MSEPPCSPALPAQEARLLKGHDGFRATRPTPPGPGTSCPSPAGRFATWLWKQTGCGSHWAVIVQAQRLRDTEGASGLPSVGGVLGAVGEAQKLLPGPKGCFLWKEEKNDTFFWFQLSVKFLLAQEAENMSVRLFCNYHEKPFHRPHCPRGKRVHASAPAGSCEAGRTLWRWRGQGLCQALRHRRQGQGGAIVSGALGLSHKYAVHLIF